MNSLFASDTVERNLPILHHNFIRSEMEVEDEEDEESSKSIFRINGFMRSYGRTDSSFHSRDSSHVLKHELAESVFQIN